MATYIKTLKEDNGDIVYPQTTTDAIYTTGGETLETRISKYVTAEDIAQSVASFGTVTTGMIADDAITTAKINDEAVTANKIDFTTLSFGNYSTSEQDTGFTWIDGSPIYKKTVSFGALPNATTKTIAHDISGLSKVIKIEGYAKNSSNVFQMMPYVPTNSNFLTNIHANTTHIEIQSVGNLSSYTECYITLYYTKS